MLEKEVEKKHAQKSCAPVIQFTVSAFAFYESLPFMNVNVLWCLIAYMHHRMTLVASPSWQHWGGHRSLKRRGRNAWCSIWIINTSFFLSTPVPSFTPLSSSSERAAQKKAWGCNCSFEWNHQNISIQTFTEIASRLPTVAGYGYDTKGLLLKKTATSPHKTFLEELKRKLLMYFTAYVISRWD